jgi:putative SOS response-associated peptidase YedK
MRYGIYPPAYMKTGGAPIYNARKDKLTTPFWKDMITSSRCFVVISAFSEWVNVSDYVKSGYATIDEIQDYFEGELEAKKTKASEKGKKYTLSKTDKTPAINRKIMPTFKLKESMEVIAPAVYNKSDNKPFYGFAIITDTPYKEVLNSGHNRSPLLIDKQAADDYLKGASLLKRVDGGLSVYL